MKLNIAYPALGTQTKIEIDDDRKLRVLYEKRMSQVVQGDQLGFPGYSFMITGGNDKQGFPMKQGVLLPHRVRLLLAKGTSCYRPRRTGERKRKSVRGCIVAQDISAISLTVVKQGEQDIPGLTDVSVPKRLGPKRANKIRKMFNLDKSDDVRKYVIRRTIEKNGKTNTKAAKIQRLVTPVTLQRKRHLKALKIRNAESSREKAAEYAQMLAQRIKEKHDKRSKRKSSRKSLVAE